MTRAQEKLVGLGLWTLYALLAAAGLGLLADALFVQQAPASLTLAMPSEMTKTLEPLPAAKYGLMDRRFTRRVAAPAAPSGPAKPQDTSLDRLIRLTGILDFGGKQPTLAVIEANGESKAYRAGDRIGETGLLIRDIKDYVIVEMDKRRFKLTFLEIQELPVNAVGKD